MAQQAPLKLPTTPADSSSLLDLVNELIRTNGPRKKSVLADQLGCSESHLSEVLAGHKHLPEAWLKTIAQNYDPEGRIAAHVAKWRGLSVVARRASDGARCRAMERVLARHNGVGALLLKEIEEEALAEPVTDEAQP